jgi:hypothetical protein
MLKDENINIIINSEKELTTVDQMRYKGLFVFTYSRLSIDISTCETVWESL